MKKIIIRAPNGFQVRYRTFSYDNKIQNVYCDLYDMTKSPALYVGNVEIERSYGKIFKTHASLKWDYHNRGLGTLLYAKAIAWGFNHGLKVQSSSDSSEMAKRVWEGKGLRKYFNIQKITDRGYSNNGIIETWYPSRKRKSK